MTKFVLRFFFEYGAGGCLWAGDDYTRQQLGYGPVDSSEFGLDGQVVWASSLSLSNTAHAMIEELDFQHSGYLNPKYPPDPSLWLQILCEHFNEGVDDLLSLLQKELDGSCKILDQQNRYTEHPALVEYLAANPELSAIHSVTKPSVY